ncbi:MAG: RNA polymerase II mediator complex subunit [Trizodia sp. TS-e1964]|nr:MAG: RNA polymerase II mediator complex subunit [Trizodia sp. TS-e1964]
MPPSDDLPPSSPPHSDAHYAFAEPRAELSPDSSVHLPSCRPLPRREEPVFELMDYLAEGAFSDYVDLPSSTSTAMVPYGQMASSTFASSADVPFVPLWSGPADLLPGAGAWPPLTQFLVGRKLSPLTFAPETSTAGEDNAGQLVRRGQQPGVCQGDELSLHILIPFPVRANRYLPPGQPKSISFLPIVLPAFVFPSKGRLYLKPFEPETTLRAPFLAPGKYADYFPWTGAQPEDVYSDAVVRQGHFDKTQVLQNEHLTARNGLLQAFRHKSIPLALSSVVTAAVNKKKFNGRITAPSTFRPPPRVTLTDMKREAWLRELANPSHPLRRLSRTIPHGIRGKVLLEQCLAKQIPIQRGVWLAKCVGANEIRASKRKGAANPNVPSGEIKWLRDWTILVEQFLEAVVVACGAEGWKQKITYAIRLAKELYSEHLLDEEHYLDWMVAALETATLDKVPAWLLVVQAHWEAVVMTRKLSRHVSAALLEKMCVADDGEDREVNEPLLSRLSMLAKEMMSEHDAAFILPDCWAKYRDVMFQFVEAEDSNAHAKFDELDERNCRLSIPTKREPPPAADSTRRIILRELDMGLTSGSLHVPELAASLPAIADKNRQLLHILLDWMCSPWRGGAAAVYLTARLLRMWSNEGLDTDALILNYLQARTKASLYSNRRIYLLVASLVRSEHFSVAKYLNWLIARGVYRRYPRLLVNDASEVRLVAELPLSNVASSTITLRNWILRQTQFNRKEEAKQFPDAQVRITHLIFPPDEIVEDAESSTALLEKMASMSRAIKGDLSVWIRNAVRLHLCPATRKRPATKNDVPPAAFSVPQVKIVRTLLETFDDFPILADVLGLVCTSNDPAVLACIADTLNYHFDTFAVIGATRGLFGKLFERHKALRERLIYDKFMLVSLLGLAAKIPSEQAAMREIKRDLGRCDPRAAAVVSSPVSEAMVDVVESSEVVFHDELDRVLASGTTMDRFNLARLFESVVSRLEASWNDCGSPITRLGLLLARLRAFKPAEFDELMDTWVERVMTLYERPVLSRSLIPLINAECLTLHQIANISGAILEAQSACGKVFLAHEIAAETLALIMPLEPEIDRGVIDEYDEYRLELKRQWFLKQHPAEALTIVRRAIEWHAPKLEKAKQQQTVFSDHFPEKIPISSMIRDIVVSEPELVNECLISPLSQGLAATLILEQVVDQLLLAAAAQSNNDADGLAATVQSKVSLDGLPEIDTAAQVSCLLLRTDDFSLPFAQMKLRVVLTAEKLAPRNAGIVKQSVIRAFSESICSVVASRAESVWKHLLSVVDKDVACQIREYAESKLMALPLPPLMTKSVSAAQIESRRAAMDTTTRGYMAILEATAWSIPPKGVPGFVRSVMHRFNDLAAILSPKKSNKRKRNPTDQKTAPPLFHTETTRSPTSLHDKAEKKSPNAENPPPPPPPATLLQEPAPGEHQQWAFLLLRLLVLHRGVFKVASSKAQTSEVLAQLLITFAALMALPAIANYKRLWMQLYDASLCLIDDLSDELKNHCVRFLAPKVSTERLRYMFGYHMAPEDTLRVWHPVPQQERSIAERRRVWMSERERDPGRDGGVYPLRRWEILNETTPYMAENDSSLNLRLFQAKKVSPNAPLAK